MNAVCSSTHADVLSLDHYRTELRTGQHWSLTMRRGTQMTLTDLTGGANVAMLMHNPFNLLERYNAPDTLKCQHTFKLTRGNCLYSDMGRIFCSITADSFGWHDSVCGNSHAEQVAAQWGRRDYQKVRNDWHQNGYDAFLVELAKYGLSRADLAANLNLFSKVISDEAGNLALDASADSRDCQVTLRFEMDTLVLLHTCPHPLDRRAEYPQAQVQIDISRAAALTADDYCLNFRPENRRGFHNNALYHFTNPGYYAVPSAQ
ncbi:urea carboxylase [Pokkaliibacter plantistimulans]|uniref:Urea carboxylase n=1 Tax=Pokkaliibacter plantistimulans TaxID=1635171 RepID=A0ABX5M2Z0_9GAMM|nr:urea amidolyase associated protein UAAP1 [Pokkaliibacter plantistimulans]PXF31260.1 urea carboxylase [Pokkaliibacter plantistimulans]